MGEQTLTIIGFPNRFQIFRANNPSDVFTQKCLCTTQEYFLPLDKKSSEIEELEIRRKNSTPGDLGSMGSWKRGNEHTSSTIADREAE